MMAITDKVQNQADGRTVQPRSNRSVKAADTRLRRKLSKIFHRDSPESGFFWRCGPGPGTPGSSHRAMCQSPRIQRCRRLTSAL